MKIMHYEEFANLPAGVIFSYYYPREYNGNAWISARTEGLYKKGDTNTLDPMYKGDHTYIEHTLLPGELSHDMDSLMEEADESLQNLWRNSVSVDHTGYWGDNREHLFLLWEHEDLNELIRNLDSAMDFTPIEDPLKYDYKILEGEEE